MGVLFGIKSFSMTEFVTKLFAEAARVAGGASTLSIIVWVIAAIGIYFVLAGVIGSKV